MQPSSSLYWCSCSACDLAYIKILSRAYTTRIELKTISYNYVHFNLSTKYLQLLEGETVNQLLEDDVLETAWWEDDNENVKAEHRGINVTAVYEVEVKVSEETLRRRGLVALIQAHERSRLSKISEPIFISIFEHLDE